MRYVGRARAKARWRAADPRAVPLAGTGQVLGALDLQGIASRPVAIWAAALVPFVVVGALTFANTSDDPLITLRYAYNLLHHGQPVFNLGERVEGYTSPLHMLLATLLTVLPGGFMLLKLKLVSVLFAGGALWQTTRLSRGADLPRWAQLTALLAVAGSWDFMVSASNGLETSLVAFLATGAVASLIDEAHTHRWWRPALWTGLLALSRPDAVLVIAGLAAVSLWRERSRPWRSRVAWLTGPAVALAALLTFRLLYYGDLVPNTYFAKQLGLGTAVSDGWTYLTNSEPLGSSGVGLVVLAIEAALIVAGVRHRVRRSPAHGYALAVVAAQLVFVLMSGGDWMKGGRFLAPVIPSATVLAFSGLASLLALPPERGGVSKRLGVVLVAGVLALLVAPPTGRDVAAAWALTGGVGDRQLIAAGHYPFSDLWVATVDLADCLTPGQTVASSEVGIFGYEHLALRVIDTRGLTDSRIAQTAPAQDKFVYGVADPLGYLTNSPVGAVLWRRRPALILTFDYRQRPTILAGRYRLVRTIPETAANETVLVYLRRGTIC